MGRRSLALNTPDGVVDLRTGKIRPHRASDYFTKLAAVGPGNADCPRWKAHLRRILNDDPDLISYLQRVLGYALTGSTREHALFFGYGTGANGKGVTVNTAAGILGDYAQTAAVETFTASHTDRHTTELAALRGARLVTVAETEEGRRWAESRIKTLTGGDTIRARFMRQDDFEFQPQFKLLISGNHKPGLRSVDEAIRRRFHLIPFVVTIPPDERDPDLAEKLKPEWPAILAWMVAGCLAWQRDRLNPPAAVRDATSAYLDAQDALAAWLEECCEQEPFAFETRAALFNSWSAWATAAGEHVGTRARFLDALEARGFEPARPTAEPRASRACGSSPRPQRPIGATDEEKANEINAVPLLSPDPGYRRNARARVTGEPENGGTSGTNPWESEAMGFFNRAQRASTSRPAGPGPARRRHGLPGARRSTRPTRWRSTWSASGAAAG